MRFLTIPIVIITGHLKSTMSTFIKRDFVMDAFGLRQFNNPSYTGTQVNFDPVEFEERINEYANQGAPLVDGYAPFCKHLFVPNFCGVKCGYAKIEENNRHLIRLLPTLPNTR